jgi:lysozyme
MITSDKGVALIQDSEGLRLTAYKDAVGIPTIGWGHTGDVKMGTTITRAEAERILREDLHDFERAVTRLVKVPLTQNQFDALVCFSFNVGAKALENSTLLRLLNAGNKVGAASQFANWNKAGGKVLPGLVTRRAAEAKLFLS